MKRPFQDSKRSHTMRWVGAIAILGLALAACAPATAAPTATLAPTTAATATVAPTTAATMAPTMAPTTASTMAPTTAATMAPTTAGTLAPTTAPAVTATVAPTSASEGGSTPPASMSGSLVVMITTNAILGPILVDASGLTLYKFANDTGGLSTCNASCLANWPPLLATGTISPGDGLNASDFGTTMTTDGRTMVTYKGSPLYYFKNDKTAGDANGNGVNGLWSVVAP